MQAMKNIILDMILSGAPTHPEEAGAMSDSGRNGPHSPEGETRFSQTKIPVQSPVERLAAMDMDQFRDFNNKVKRGESNIIDPPMPDFDANEYVTQSGPDGPLVNFQTEPADALKQPFRERHPNTAALSNVLGLDEEGLWWTDDMKNLLLNPQGVLEGLLQTATSVPGMFFGGL